MSDNYVGVDGIARKVNSMYVGVDGVARKVTKGYIGVNGVARQFYSSKIEFDYTGKYTESTITSNGVNYLLLTLTSSGELSLPKNTPIEVWLCGGGGNGANATYDETNRGTSGGGGGGGRVASGNFKTSELILSCNVGSTGSYSSITCGDYYIAAAGGSNANGKKGGSGGSGGGRGADKNGYGNRGSSDKVSTVPFDDLVNFTYHCTGGAGGQAFTGDQNTDTYMDTLYVYINGGLGSLELASKYGGGTGGVPVVHYAGESINGGNATFFGCGGGGGASNSRTRLGTYGKGYQGVIYIRIKL